MYDFSDKRQLIFYKANWFKKKENIERSKKVINEILDEWNVIDKIDIVKDRMKLYKFDDKIEEMETRFHNYKEIVMKEFN